jgi:hypothetical protein
LESKVAAPINAYDHERLRTMPLFSKLFVIAVASVTGIIAVQAGAQPRTTTPTTSRIPAGFQKLDDRFWEGPWIFAATNSGRAITRWHNRAAIATPVPFRFDDGTTGTVRAYAGPCLNPAECGGPRDDCGCFESDSYWIDTVDAMGRAVAHLHLWAAYGGFDVIPVDLIDAVGDEVVIVRIPARSAPPTGLELQIWKLSLTGAVSMLTERALAMSGYIQTVEGAIPCARWRNQLLVNRSSAKPRSIMLRANFAADDWPESGCHLSDDGAKEVSRLQRGQRLQFEGGHYQLRPN